MSQIFLTSFVIDPTGENRATYPREEDSKDRHKSDSCISVLTVSAIISIQVFLGHILELMPRGVGKTSECSIDDLITAVGCAVAADGLIVGEVDLNILKQIVVFRLGIQIIGKL